MTQPHTTPDDPVITRGLPCEAARHVARLVVQRTEESGPLDPEAVAADAVRSALASMRGRDDWSRETAAAVARRTVENLFSPEGA